MTCLICNDSGITASYGVSDFCMCPAGPTARIRSNFTAITCRAHTDTHDDRQESIAGSSPVEPFKDITFMAPEQVAALLAKVTHKYAPSHFCRAIGCGNKVDYCGDHCARCLDEISALKAHYDKQDRTAKNIAAAFWPATGIVVLAFGLIAFAWAKFAGWL